MFHNIPELCFYKIIEHLDIKDTINLCSISKSLANNFIMNNNSHLWLFLINKNYNKLKTSYYKKQYMLYKSYKTILIKLYKTRCSECCHKTSKFNMFYKKPICNLCEKNNDKYKTITEFKINKNYGLTKSDIRNVNYIIKISNENCRYRKKLYLLKDIIKIHNHKFKRKDDFIFYKLKKYQNYINYINNRMENEYKLVEFFIDNNLNFNLIKPYMNQYTNKLYSNFLRRTRPSGNLYKQVLSMSLELYYYIQFTEFSFYTERIDNSKFTSILYFSLLDLKYNEEKDVFLKKFSKEHFENSLDTIMYYKKDVLIRYKEVYDKLVDEYNGYYVHSYDKIHIELYEKSQIYDYIFNGFTSCKLTCLNDIIDEDILYRFLNYQTHYFLIKETEPNQDEENLIEKAMDLYVQININFEDNIDQVIQNVLKKKLKNKFKKYTLNNI